MTSNTLILGINCVYHESSACVFRGTQLIAFVEEERFTRVKRAKTPSLTNADELPLHSIDYCLRAAAATWSDVDVIAVSFDPSLRVRDGDGFVGQDDGWGGLAGEDSFGLSVRNIPNRLSELAAVDVRERVRWIPHHVSHAASAYFCSAYDRAAVVSVDGIGEVATAALAHGEGPKLHMIGEHIYPHSIGLLWEVVSLHLGQEQFSGPGKLMALAAYGDPSRYRGRFGSFVSVDERGLRIDNRITRFRDESNLLYTVLGAARGRGSEMDTDAADIAAALQEITEDFMMVLATRAQLETRSENLCLAGGVSLNSRAAGILARSGLFESIFVQPAANDAGTALGAALAVLHGELGHDDRFVMRHPYWGPRYSPTAIERATAGCEFTCTRVDDVANHSARLLAQGSVIGWFQGAMEVGPRALGNRSILADPRVAGAKDAINLHAKHREYWRPFSPAIMSDDVAGWIEQGCDSPSHGFMSFTYPVNADRRAAIPAAVHIDGTARAQTVTPELNPLFYRLLSEFKAMTGVPALLNTSFNGPGEPIVCTPADALRLFRRSGLNALILGDVMVTR